VTVATLDRARPKRSGALDAALAAVLPRTPSFATSIVNVSLPVMARHFGVPVGGAIEWVMIAYLVVIAETLLTVGRLSDYFGRKRIWLAGLAVFTLGSAACGAAPALGLLIAARVAQGIGGSLLIAVSPVLQTAAFRARARGRAPGLNATIVALGSAPAPPWGASSPSSPAGAGPST
jgi:MFS family permease